MRLLLDTHIFLWCIKNDKQLTKKIRTIIKQAEEIYVSSVSIWEIAIKAQLGKLHAEIDQIVDIITESGFRELPLTAKHAIEVYDLPDIHKDPFDRILIAQTISEPLKFLTADSALQKYSDLIITV